MKLPQNAMLLLGRKTTYPIAAIHFKTKQVTLKESDKVYNTVSIKDICFDYSGFDEEDIKNFHAMFN
ncbi:MAG: hypothetical protein J1G06_08665 [Oscillospiraceae bacterium]|nr:hypothetical protein [Oscillospiraceae bacterium]